MLITAFLNSGEYILKPLQAHTQRGEKSLNVKWKFSLPFKCPINTIIPVPRAKPAQWEWSDGRLGLCWRLCRSALTCTALRSLTLYARTDFLQMFFKVHTLGWFSNKTADTGFLSILSSEAASWNKSQYLSLLNSKTCSQQLLCS